MCLCSMHHPATVRGIRTRRLIEERARGVLWCHASVNLVEPPTIALAAANILRRTAEGQISVSIPESGPQPLPQGK